MLKVTAGDYVKLCSFLQDLERQVHELAPEQRRFPIPIGVVEKPDALLALVAAACQRLDLDHSLDQVARIKVKVYKETPLLKSSTP
jgi:hypothetical protein